MPIVYVDDEPMLCRAFQRVFEEADRPVVTFTDPDTALAYLRDHPVSVIVCDYRMPTMTGLQLLERFTGDAPFFLMSGDLEVASLVKHLPRVTGLLAKPFKPEQLLEFVLPISAPASS